MTTAISYTDWLTWAASNEATLVSIDNTIQALHDAYDEAIATFEPLEGYLNIVNYKFLVYRFALHLLIVNGGGNATAAILGLYTKYDIVEFSGIISGAGDSGSSAQKLIPAGVQAGDLQTMMLFATPYGKQVEVVQEQLRNLAIVC